jgi:proteasome accessory factor A
MGTTSLVLAMIEDQALDAELSVRKPVATLHAVSHDPTLQKLIELRDGRKMTAVQLLWIYYEHAERYLQTRSPGAIDEDTAEVMTRWSSVLTKLERDPMECVREIDWVAKLALLQGYRDRDGLEWSDPRLKAIDIQWSDIRPEKGLFHRLFERGRIESLIDDAAVKSAVTNPPEDTRAYFRGRCLEKYSGEIAAASWDSVIFDVPGQSALQRVPMLEPLRGTREGVGDLIDRSPDASTLLRELAAVTT